MKEIFIIVKKELRRVFTDKKLIVSMFVLPAALVIGIYALMGILVSNMLADQEQHEATVLIYGMPEETKAYLEEADALSSFQITYTDSLEEVGEQKKQVYAGELDLIVVFEDNFIEKINAYEAGSAYQIPEIQTFYNPSEDYSYNARDAFVNGVLEPYRQVLLADRIGDMEQLTIFTIDEKNEESAIQNEGKAQGKMLGMMIPYIITILLFASAMSLGIDMITGEKERGTMAALLITPVKRSAIVYGKLLALMILSGISALVYGISMVVALPIMASGMLGMDEESVTDITSELSQSGFAIQFSLTQVFMLLVIIVSLVFVYVALIAIPAVFAKDMKEGNSLVMPVYILVMVSGMITMFGGEDVSSFMYLVPLYGSTIALKGIFTMDITLINFCLTVVSNLVTGGLLALIVTKAFKSERIMFNA